LIAATIPTTLQAMTMTLLEADATETDATLVELSRQGDQTAYGQLVARHQTLVCSVAYAQCGDFALSEDLAQEAFLTAWKKLSDLQEPSKFKSWICTIVRNLASRAVQRERTASEFNEATLTDGNRTAESDAISAEESRLVWQAVAALPENYREPLVLFYREEESVARVAAALELSTDAVKQRLSRGRQMLQQELAATVENALRNSRPSSAFTVAVVAGLSTMMTSTATAAGLGAFAKTAGPGIAKAGAGLSFIPVVPILLQLPLVGWLVKMSFDLTRSPSERQLTRRFFIETGIVLLLFGFVFYTIIKSPEVFPSREWARGTRTALMIAMNVFVVAWSWRLGKRLKTLREQEGNDTPRRPISLSIDKQTAWLNSLFVFLGSSLLVAAWPASVGLLAGDWAVSLGFLTIAVAIAAVAFRLSRAFSKYEFQCYGLSIPLLMLLGTGLTFWRKDIWTPGIEGTFWFMGALMGMSTTAAILIGLVNKRVHGRPG
jgi:RNA polymerase sigma factor (sigma-70 family)